jgi:hypothetical protein
MRDYNVINGNHKNPPPPPPFFAMKEKKVTESNVVNYKEKNTTHY